jgi:NAD(P)-dependent dehydrogenase (short-subunit alcohol dehydrogenase family)
MAAESGVGITIVEFDASDGEGIRRVMDQIASQKGSIDVLVNCAGVGGNAVVEDISAGEFLRVMETNVLGPVRCIQACLPYMRKRRQGVIVNISSVAGRYAAVAQASYVASKWALEGLSEQLALEVAPFGIRVAIIEPGVTKSAIFAKNADVSSSNPEYAGHYHEMFNFYRAGLANATDPREVAKVVYEAVVTDSPRLRYPCSWGAQELISGRDAMSDRDWTALGRAIGSDEFVPTFREVFNLDLSRPTPGPA